VPLPGHALGQHGLLCRHRDGSETFLVADAAWVLTNITVLSLPAEPPLRLLGHRATIIETLKKLHALHRRRSDLAMLPSLLDLLRACLAARRLRTLRVPQTPPLALTDAQARAYADQELATGVSPLPPYSFGLSSGTTGDPGVFITTPAERARWADNILGKYIPPHRLPGLRAALFLKHNNCLYSGVRGLRYFGLTAPYPDPPGVPTFSSDRPASSSNSPTDSAPTPFSPAPNPCSRPTATPSRKSSTSSPEASTKPVKASSRSQAFQHDCSSRKSRSC